MDYVNIKCNYNKVSLVNKVCRHKGDYRNSYIIYKYQVYINPSNYYNIMKRTIRLSRTFFLSFDNAINMKQKGKKISLSKKSFECLSKLKYRLKNRDNIDTFAHRCSLI